MEITSPEELTECLLNGLKCKGLYYFVKLIKSTGCDSNTSADVEIRKRDLISHYVLRLSLCKKKKTLDWFVKLEEKLFKIRFNSLNRYGVEKFLALHNFDYPTVSIIQIKIIHFYKNMIFFANMNVCYFFSFLMKRSMKIEKI